jgi:hypothetical protein
VGANSLHNWIDKSHSVTYPSVEGSWARFDEQFARLDILCFIYSTSLWFHGDSFPHVCDSPSVLIAMRSWNKARGFAGDLPAVTLSSSVHSEGSAIRYTIVQVVRTPPADAILVIVVANRAMADQRLRRLCLHLASWTIKRHPILICLELLPRVAVTLEKPPTTHQPYPSCADYG